MKSIKDIYYNDITRYSSKWEQYFDIYEKWFSKFREESPTVLEIGVDCGGSLEMWKKYFGSTSRVVGVDINPKVTDIPGCEIIRGDQGNKSFWENFLAGCPNLDVVIDDGSHFMDHQITTFLSLFDHLKDGGIYLVEDTHTSYWNDKEGKILGSWDGGYKTPGSFIEGMKNLVDILHEDHIPDTENTKEILEQAKRFRNVMAIHFYDSVVVIEKGLRPKYEVTYTNREKSF